MARGVAKPKTCAWCGHVVDRGTGVVYRRRLVHRACRALAKIQGWRMRR
ncbi:MAG: hypothetical protein JRN54_04780 [Nitrososphaerota archaeon]|nr:hypothetical protein [Nitrososphaerota archaeon]